MIVNSYSNDETVLEAESGKIFVHARYKIMYGDEVILGTTVDKNGNYVKETEEDYIEIDVPDNYELGGILTTI